MTGAKSFRYWWGVHMHFTVESYSMLRYGVDTQPAKSKYEKLSPAQRHVFDWFSEKFISTEEAVFACIGNELASQDIRYESRTTFLQTAKKYSAKRESLSYSLKLEYKKHESLDLVPLNKLLHQYLAGNFSPEYILLLDSFENQIQRMYEHRNFIWAKPEILKLIKYKDFISLKKHQPIIEHHVNQVSEA